MTKRLVSYQMLQGIIRCETGLHIGGTKDSLEIGGLDNPVIKHPITDLPYIPGSSLKGKLRSLLEHKYGKFEPTGEPYRGKKNDEEDRECPISRIFGPHHSSKHNFGPTRIIVRDASLTEASQTELEKRKIELGGSFLELKTETSIDRNIGIARNGTLRTHERVPAGTEFGFEIVIRNFDWGLCDETTENLKTVAEALQLLTYESLGGSGSRGYGKVSFHSLLLNGEPYALR